MGIMAACMHDPTVSGPEFNRCFLLDRQSIDVPSQGDRFARPGPF